MYTDGEGFFALPLIFATPFLEVIVGAIAAAAPYILVAVAVILAVYIAIEVLELIEENSQTNEENDDEKERETPEVEYPGDDPSKSPGEGFEWKGRGNPESGEGSWYNKKTGESLHPDLHHKNPIGPHWDYRNSNGEWFRIFYDHIGGK